MHRIDELAYSSKLNSMHPGYKCMIALISIGFCITTRSVIIGISVLCYTSFITIFIGKINWIRYVKLFMIPIIFLCMSTITIIFEISDLPISFYEISFVSYYIGIQPSSFLFAMQLVITALASVSSLYFLSLSTPMTDILQVLKDIRIPNILIELMLLIYRLIFVIYEMVDRQRVASQTRLGNHNFKQSMISMGSSISTVCIRSLRKSSSLYEAMEARCYNGEIKVVRLQYALSGKNLFWLLLMVLYLSGMTVFHIHQIVI